MHTLTGAFPARAHGIVGVIVIAGAVTVTVHRRIVLFANRLTDLTVVLATGRHLVDFEQLSPVDHRRSDLARVKLIARVETALDALQHRIQRTEKLGGIFGAHALAMLTPEQTLVFLSQAHHFIGNFTDQRFLSRILHVDGRAHMQHPGIHMAEHAVSQASIVQHLAKCHDVISQIFRRYCGIFNEWNGPLLALSIAQQAHRLFAHAPNLVDLGGTVDDGVAEALARLTADGFQMPAEFLYLGTQFSFIIAGILHQVDALNRRVALLLREVVTHRIPDDVAHGQVQHLGIHGFDGSRAPLHQRLGIAHGRLKAVVFDIDQRRMLGNRQHVELGFGDERQRAFATTEDGVQVETAGFIPDMGQVVAGQAAVQFREAGIDFGLLSALNLIQQTMGFAHTIRARLDAFQFFITDRAGLPDAAIKPYTGQFKHMVTGFAVQHRTLPTGVGVDHAADRGAVAGGQLRGEKQAIGFERGIELILDHPCLNAYPALVRIDLQNAVHVLGHIDDQAVGQRLTIGAGAAATGAEYDFAKARLICQGGDHHQIITVFRVEHALWQHLVDTVIGRQYHTVGIVRVQLTLEALLLQGFNKIQIQALGVIDLVNTRDHGALRA